MTRSIRPEAEVRSFTRPSLSVQSKLIVAFVLLTLASIAVVSWVGYVTARQSLRAASERQLMSLQRSKSALVQNILKSARNEVLGLSASRLRRTQPENCRQHTDNSDRSPSPPEMQAEVRRFYRDEFEPALAEKTAIKPPEGSLLPVTQTGWYLHYHYLATGAKPYSVENINRSATDRSAYGQAIARRSAEIDGQLKRLGRKILRW